MTTQRTLMTAEELARLPDTGQRYELVRGELITMAPPGGVHGRTTTRIDRRLDTYVEGEGLGVVVAGDVGFFLSHNRDTVRAPDVAFISTERLPEGGLAEGYIEGPPDLSH